MSAQASFPAFPSQSPCPALADGDGPPLTGLIPALHARAERARDEGQPELPRLAEDVRALVRQCAALLVGEAVDGVPALRAARDEGALAEEVKGGGAVEGRIDAEDLLRGEVVDIVAQLVVVEMPEGIDDPANE